MFEKIKPNEIRKKSSKVLAGALSLGIATGASADSSSADTTFSTLDIPTKEKVLSEVQMLETIAPSQNRNQVIGTTDWSSASLDTLQKISREYIHYGPNEENRSLSGSESIRIQEALQAVSIPMMELLKTEDGADKYSLDAIKELLQDPNTESRELISALRYIPLSETSEYKIPSFMLASDITKNFFESNPSLEEIRELKEVWSWKAPFYLSWYNRALIRFFSDYKNEKHIQEMVTSAGMHDVDGFIQSLMFLDHSGIYRETREEAEKGFNRIIEILTLMENNRDPLHAQK